MSVVAEATAKDTRARLPIGDLRVSTVLAPIAFGVAVLGLWELGVQASGVEPFIVPAPSDIWREVLDSSDSIAKGARVTGTNALVGLAIGGVLGALVAHAVRVVDQMTVPVVAAASVVPIVALAPALYRMYGGQYDTTRMLVAALSVSVPVYLNTLRGLRQVTAVHRDLMTASSARPWQVARVVTLPTATPYVFTGLRIASSLAVISALVAEYFGGPVSGLGKSITTSVSSSNYPLAWAYVVGSIVLGLVFYVVTLLLDLWFSRHHPEP
ncbi:ABC transporter permease [Nocardioides sp.]|uniref:ABC transporter permease n=1 Tax=Nocardioides sp. TaxID=35761 RepID=UPI00271F0FE2|nr:ABC transporter permease subunit [Nocardioides sp.]MDO9457906.1 ABC transporter permease subunit [Nocardioides sp.]